MVTLTPQLQAYLVALCLVLLIVVLVLLAVLGRRARKLKASAETTMRKHLLIELLDRMRHRNFRGFQQVLNESRQKSGLALLDERTLLKVRYDVKVTSNQLLESQ